MTNTGVRGRTCCRLWQQALLLLLPLLRVHIGHSVACCGNQRYCRR
jgi:hypothetical protein